MKPENHLVQRAMYHAKEFHFANAGALYRQGASCSLLEALAGRDPQSGKLVIQLLVDWALPLE